MSLFLQKSLDKIMFITKKCYYVLHTNNCILISITVTVLFFGGLFFYYTRGKNYIDKYVKDKDWPELPQMPKIPKKFTSALHWPLSNVQIKNLPIFLKKEAKVSNR